MRRTRLNGVSAALVMGTILLWGTGGLLDAIYTGPGPIQTACAQDEAAAPADEYAGGDYAAEEPSAEEIRPQSLIDYWKQGGPTMYPLLALAIWATAVLVELLMKLRVSVFCPALVVNQIREAIYVGDYPKAWRIAAENPSVFSRIFYPAVEKVSAGRDVVEDIAVDTASNENSKFKTKIANLSLIAGIAPMMGLFGTISGMISAFNKMAYEGAVGDPTKLAGSIGEALITTYGGLLVAIPCMLIFYLIGNKLKTVMTATQNMLNEILDSINFASIPQDFMVVTRELKAKVLGGAPPPPMAGAKRTTGSVPPPPPAAAAPQQAPAAGQLVPCPSCGKQIAVGAKKCPGCGTDLEWE